MSKKPCICSEWSSTVRTLSIPDLSNISAITLALIGTLSDLTLLSCLAYPKYGITAVILPAEDHLKASTITVSYTHLTLPTKA